MVAPPVPSSGPPRVSTSSEFGPGRGQLRRSNSARCLEPLNTECAIELSRALRSSHGAPR
eukprot:13412786-Alexandrium_andersonii.AAC.1